MSYAAPLSDILATLRVSGALDEQRGDTLTLELVETILTEAGRFAAEEIAPLNAVADRNGPRLAAGVVTTTPGWKELYAAWRDGGWNALSAPEEWGGQALPATVQGACREIWNSASMAFGIGPTLTEGSIEALLSHATDALRATFLPSLVAGRWMGTMNLTEPQSGSDLSGIRTRAERHADGSYRIFGQKIYITYGEHDLAKNIVHLVLARLPDAPPGTKGISLFLVPKFLVDADGALGARNDLVCAGLEHKLGLHGSPTCTMIFGERDGATGYLVGEENRGLNCMFTMMNNTRLAVGIQGVGIAERALQQARSYAATRMQGRADPTSPALSPIIAHPDVQRMLLTMKALTGAARAICYKAAAAIDRGGEAAALASLLTPVAKAFSTDIGVEVASLGIQVHGGMGYIEETGAAQHLRDARIAPIYEGTNGIQAIDLVMRRIGQDGGATIGALIASMEAALAGSPAAALLAPAIADLRVATDQLLSRLAEGRRDQALAGASHYLRLLALVIGGVELQRIADAEANPQRADGRRLLAAFYRDAILVASGGLVATIATSGHHDAEALAAALG